MELRDLFSTGSHLSDVPVHFHGMTLLEWTAKKWTEQCNRYLATLPKEDAPLSKKAVWTPRDSYGLKGI